ncbi:hypothetical protein C0995_003107, partial [Termitomyces sp. Mi166
MDALNALREVEESQQDFKRHQNAARRQAMISGVPLRAVSDIKITMSKVVDEEVEILQPPQIPGWHITIKEEALEHSVPAGAENSQVIVRRIPMVDSWNEHVNYQRMRNQDLHLQGRLLINDQGVVFEGRSGVTPIDNIKQQFVARQERQEPKEHPNNTGDSRENNDGNEKRHGQHDRTNRDD